MLPDADPTLAAASSPSPSTADAPPARTSMTFFWWVSALTILVDQTTKLVISRRLPLYGGHTVIPGLFDLVHVQNAGVAFGLLNDSTLSGRSLLTTVLAIVALAGIAYYARHIRAEERWARLGLSLILGGAIGNLADRLRQGYVVDFVDVYWRNWHFWAFNVADAAITVGAVLVFVELLVVSRHASHSV